MLLQVVLVMVAPFGTTRMASAVANCSDGPWAVARLPPARAEEPHRIVAIKTAACRITPMGGDVFGLHRTGAGDSLSGLSNSHDTSAGFDAAAQVWIQCSDPLRELEVGLTVLRAGQEDAASPMRHQTEPLRDELALHYTPAMAERRRLTR